MTSVENVVGMSIGYVTGNSELSVGNYHQLIPLGTSVPTRVEDTIKSPQERRVALVTVREYDETVEELCAIDLLNYHILKPNRSLADIENISIIVEVQLNKVEVEVSVEYKDELTYDCCFIVTTD